MSTYVDQPRRKPNVLSRIRLRPDLLTAAFFLFLVLVAGWPVLTRLNTVIIGDDIDVYINPWADWWTLKALTDSGYTLWWTDYIYYPGGADLTYHSFSHLLTAVSLLLRPFVGALPAYNLSVLLNYFLIALSMFHLARYWTGSTTAGLLAGIVFAFNSHSLYQSSHPVLLSIWTLPWTALFLLKALEKNDFKYAALAGLFVFLTTLVGALMLILLALWLAFLGTFMLVSRRWKLSQWPIFALFLLVAVLPSLPFLQPLLGSAFIGHNTSFIIDPYASIVTDIASPLVPHWINWYTRGIYFGILPTALLILSLGRWPETRFWWLLLLAAFLFAIGPRPMFRGQEVDVVLPWSLTLAPLLRNMYRLNILVSLGLAMLTACGWLVFASHLPQRRGLKTALALMLGLLIFADYLKPSFPYTSVSVPPFYTQVVAQMPEDAAIAIVPTGRQYDKPHLFYQTLHQRKMVNGVVSRAPTETLDFIVNNPLLRAAYYDLPPVPLPRQPHRALSQLAAVDVHYLIIEKGWERVDVEDWRAALPFPPFYEDARVLVYRTDVSQAQTPHRLDPAAVTP